MSDKKIKNKAAAVLDELKTLANPKKAQDLAKFFQVKKGGYGENDQFFGIVVPVQRQVAKQYFDLPLSEIKKLLDSCFHEARLTGTIILVNQYQKNTSPKKQLFAFYLANLSGINNWDLVDLSAPQIVGHHLFDKEKDLLDNLVIDQNLWKRRVAIVATQYFIRNNHFATTLKLAKKLLKDREDLLHKATGWMLREVGKRDFDVLNDFLLAHYQKMPRTMLRYAIEKFPDDLRKKFLA
jgi:3-methyladenine DNA glycosylase AlkD